MTALNHLDATAAAHQIASGKITSEQLVRDCLEHIAARESAVGAWAHLNADAAITRARELDQAPLWSRGLLHGVPIAVKDLIDTRDMPATYGTAIYANHRPMWDAPCVALTRAAGAVVLGKTVSTELAYFTPGKTANPRNLAHTPGGSSSGSAAAVADQMIPFAFGTQTAGSVIRPAAFCGVVGYKPSFGLISRAGVKALSDSLDTVGVLARTVADAALLAAASSGRGELVITDHAPPAAPRVGICRGFEWSRTQPETQAAMALAVRKLGAAGVAMVDVELPPNFAGAVQAQIDIMAYEMARSLAYEWLAHREQLSQKLRELIAAGLALPRARYDAAVTLARNCRRMSMELFSRADILLVPSAAGEAPHGLVATGDPLFNRLWTLLHTPCVHLPFTQGPCGLPVGLQVIGPIGADRATLLHANFLHQKLL